jgi:hypothetical protein
LKFLPSCFSHFLYFYRRAISPDKTVITLAYAPMDQEESLPNPVSSKAVKSFDSEVGASQTSLSSRLAWWFGGKNVIIGARIAPVPVDLLLDSSDTDDTASAILNKQKELEDGHSIQYRTCIWQKACSF